MLQENRVDGIIVGSHNLNIAEYDKLPLKAVLLTPPGLILMMAIRSPTITTDMKMMFWLPNRFPPLSLSHG